MANYALVPLKNDNGRLEFNIIYTQDTKVYRLTDIFYFDDAKSDVAVADSDPYGWNEYETLNNIKQRMKFMKIKTLAQPLKINLGANNEVLLLEHTSLAGYTTKSYQSGLYDTPDPFFYEDLLYSFFINPPSSKSTLGKSAFQLKNLPFKMGANIWMASDYKPKISAVNSMKPILSKFKYTTSGSTTTSFYEASHSSQVVVRVKDNETLSQLSGKDVSFGNGPSSINSNTSAHLSSKLKIEVNGYHFYPFYHPYTTLFLQQLNRLGIDGLLDPSGTSVESKELLHQATPSQKTITFFKERYKPNMSEVVWFDAKEEIDFRHGGVFSTYNWELFYHIPLFIATKLSQDQRFDEAQRWFHYIFDPTETQGEIPHRFWKIKPFYTYTIVQIKADIEALMKGGAAIKHQIKAWKENPFNPHMLARFRRLAYMKTVVMKYLDNLIAWGDQLFRMDSIESMNEATQLYILAGQILGKLPVESEAKLHSPKSFNELAAQLTEMGNAWVNLENSMMDEFEEDFIMYSSKKSGVSHFKNGISKKIKNNKTQSMGSGGTTSILDDILYFCMSPNEKLLLYWNTVAERLFKIRNCMNIEGLVRSVPLFQPPIDPALLVKAAAAGIDISSAINDLYAPMPLYRFQILLQKAKSLCQQLESLGGTLLSALEKRDAEQIASIRMQHEIVLLEATKDIKRQQLEEARLAVISLEESYNLVRIKYDNYSQRDFMNPGEVAAIILSTGATVMQVISAATASSAAVAAQAPDYELSLHAQGISSGSSGTTKIPGSGDKNKDSAMSISRLFDVLAIISRDLANNVSTVAGYERRMEEWDLQIDLAEQEMKQINKQILAAQVRQEISAREKENLDLQIENTKQADAFMREKYTNQELYNWFIGRISGVYFQTYKMAYDLAKKVEKAFCFELGIESSNYIQFGHWDNLKKGLLSGEKLHHDLNRLEMAFLDKNKREYEITKHISLAQLDPIALIRLRSTGISDFEIPEVLYDLDYPGQYFRRLKSISISIPCIAGPYTSVCARLSLTKSSYRKNTNGTTYPENPSNDDRFIYNIGAIQSIATSYAQNDSGMFELNFRDDRYLPFEGTGAISSWHLELPTKARQFDYNTISDVIIHIKYTAREGGSGLKSAANTVLKDQLAAINQDLSQTGLHMAINMKHDMPNEWHLLKKAGSIDLLLDKSRLPYMVQVIDTAEIESVFFVAKVKDNPATFTVNVDGTASNLARVDELQLCTGINTDIEIGQSFELSIAEGDKLKLEELLLVVKYKF